MENREDYNNSFKDNDHLFKLIRNIDPSIKLDENINKLISMVTKPELTGAVAYLQQHFTAKYPVQMNVFVTIKNITKNTLLSQLIQFVEKTLPVLCQKCETAYTPMTQDGSALDDVSCIKCKIPAHRDCYKPETININQGLVYMCLSCLVNMGKGEEAKEEEKKEEEKSSDSKGEDESDDDE